MSETHNKQRLVQSRNRSIHIARAHIGIYILALRGLELLRQHLLLRDHIYDDRLWRLCASPEEQLLAQISVLLRVYYLLHRHRPVHLALQVQLARALLDKSEQRGKGSQAHLSETQTTGTKAAHAYR